MKAGWEIKKLGDVFLFENGDRGENYPSKSVQTSSGVPFINAGHLKNQVVDFSNMNYISKLRFNLLGSGKVKKNDILFCLRGSLGKFACVGDLEEAAIASSLVIIRPRDIILNNFAMAYFQSCICQDMIEKFRNGAAQPNLSAGSLKKFIIPVPPLSEQRRIVAILDEVFSGIDEAKEKAEQNLKNAKEVFEALLQDTFLNHSDDWEEKPIKRIGITQTGITPHTSDKENYGDYIPFIKPADIDIDGFGNINYSNFGLSKKGLSSGRLIKKNSILMVCIGASIGKTGFSEREISCNQQINSLTVNNNLESKFFYYALKRRSFFDEVILNSAQATLPIINKSRWENISVKYPKSVAEQRRIVSQFDSITAETSRLESIYQQKLSNLEELKKSLLQQAFSGAL